MFISFDPLEPPFCFCCQNPVFDSRSLIATATTSGCFRHHCAHHTTLMQEKATPTRPQKEQTTVLFLDYHSVIIKKWNLKKKTWTWSSPLKQKITRKSHFCDQNKSIQTASNVEITWDFQKIFLASQLNSNPGNLRNNRTWYSWGTVWWMKRQDENGV